MFAGEELSRLEQQKRLLIAQADLQRHLLRVEFSSWGERLHWLRAGQSALGSFRPYWVLAAGLAGLGASVVKWRTVLRWAPRLFAMWRLARGFLRQPAHLK